METPYTRNPILMWNSLYKRTPDKYKGKPRAKRNQLYKEIPYKEKSTERNPTSNECENRCGMSSGHPSPGTHNCVIAGELLLRHTSRFWTTCDSRGTWTLMMPRGMWGSMAALQSHDSQRAQWNCISSWAPSWEQTQMHNYDINDINHDTLLT